MKKLLIGVMALGLVMSMNASAFAVGIPFCPPPASPNAAVTFVCVNVGGDIFTAPITPAAKGSSASLHVVRTGYQIDLTALLNPDPVINYSLLATNLGASPLAFSFIFFEPIVPVGASNQVQSSLSGLFTDGGTAGVTVSPTGSKIAVNTVSADGGTTLTNMGVDVGPSGTAAGFYGPYTVGPLAGPDPGAGNSWNTLGVNLSFLVSAGDTAQFSGSGEIVPNPEPGTLLLLGSGLAVVGISVRKRLRRSW